MITSSREGGEGVTAQDATENPTAVAAMPSLAGLSSAEEAHRHHEDAPADYAAFPILPYAPS